MFQIWLTILYGLWNEYTIGYGQRRKSCAFPVGKESAGNVGDPGSIPGLGRSAGEGIGYPLQYSWASLVAQLVKNPPTPVFWPGEFRGLKSIGPQRVEHD